MGSPRGVLLLVLLVLTLLLGTVGMMVRSGESDAVQAGKAPAREAEDGSVPPRLEPAEESSDGRALELPPFDPNAVPEALAAKFEKRYRGFAPDALDLARVKLGETLRVRADQALRERLKTDGSPTTRPVIDLAQEESTRELYLEIAWLDARLPKKE